MNTFLRIIVLTFVLPAATGIAHAQVKIGTVDMNRVFTDYYKTKDAQTKYSEAEKAANDELNTRVEALKKGMQEINQANGDLQRQNLSKDDLEAKRKALQPKIDAARALDREIADFRSSKQKALQDQFLRMRKDIVEDIMKTVNEIVKTKAFDMVFDKSGLSAGAVPVVLYSRDDLDISADVTAALNKNAPAKASK